MGAEGRELSQKRPENPHLSKSRGTKSGTLESDLDRLIVAWPTLPGTVKARIMELVERGSR